MRSLRWRCPPSVAERLRALASERSRVEGRRVTRDELTLEAALRLLEAYGA